MSIEFPNQSEKLELPVIGSSAYVLRNPDATHPDTWMDAGWTVERCEGDIVVVIKPVPGDVLEKRPSLKQFNEYQQAGMSEAGPAFDSDKFVVVPPFSETFDPDLYEIVPPISADRAQAFGGGVAAVVGVKPPARIELIKSMPDWSQSPAPVEAVNPGLEALEVALKRLDEKHDAIKNKYDPETQMNLWKVYAYKNQPAGGEAYQALSMAARNDVADYIGVLEQRAQILDRLAQ